MVAVRGIETARVEWQPTIDYLNRTLSQHEFTLTPVIPSNYKKIRSLVRDNRIDFVITQPAFYVDLELNFGISKILTMVKKGGYSQFGSTIIVRADSDIKSLHDLRGSIVSGVAKLGFGGWLVGYKEMLDNGFDPHIDAQKVLFLGTQPRQIHAVLNREVDVAVIRTGMLEKVTRNEKISIDQFRVLAEKNHPDFNLKVSTQLYPEWAFARTKKVSNDLSKSVALTLLSMQANSSEASLAGFKEWTFPYDYQPVHDLLKALQVGPYQGYGEVELKNVVIEHWPAVVTIIFLLTSIFIIFLVWNRKLENEIENRRQVEVALRKNEEQLKLHANVFNTSTEGILITTPEPVIITVNEGLTKLTGYSKEEVIGQNPRIFSSKIHAADFYRHMWSELTEKGYWEGDITNRRKDGRLIIEWLRISQITNSEGVPTHYVGLFSDITRKKQSEEELHLRAHYDHLTKISNRLSFMERLNQELNRAKRNNSRLALLYIDLNKFKLINDTYGHHVGDYVLCEIARRLQNSMREIDAVARLGGDEFTLLLTDIVNYEEIKIIENRVLTVLQVPVDYEGVELNTGASIGVAVFPDNGSNAEELIKSADKAMYKSKQKIRDSL